MLEYLYEGWLISNAHSKIFCQQSKVAMRTQCVLVATTLVQIGAKFHSFLYTSSKTVHVSMESCYGGMSTGLKQRAVTGNTVNSARYIETIKNLRQRVCRVKRSTSRILLLHDNARLHTARATIDALETLKFEVLSHPPYSPDLAPSDFHFFPHLKRHLKGTHFTSGDEVKQAVTSWIKQRTPEFFIDGMHKLVLRWEKCIERQGDYVKK